MVNWQSKYKTLDAFVEAKIAPKVVEAATSSYTLQETIQKVFPKSWKGVKGKAFRDWVTRARELGHKIPPLQTLFKKREKLQKPQLDNIRFPFTRAKELDRADRFIITSALNDVPVMPEFWRALELYAKQHEAMIIVAPARYLNPTTRKQDDRDDYQWPAEVQPYLTDDMIELHEHLVFMAQARIPATSTDPLRGKQDLSKGRSAIFAHAQIAMEMVPTPQNSHPKVLWTTGSVSESLYSDTDRGIRARFHHSHAAMVVELDGPRFHARSLNWDGDGFYDVAGGECRYYTEKGSHKDRAEALCPGDEHAKFADPDCEKATYHGDDSICSAARPKKVVRNDIFDGYSISHHHDKNPVTRIAKARNGDDLVEAELILTRDYIDRTTPKDAENIVVPSNHHDHLLQWMKRHSPGSDPRNADILIDLWHALKGTIKLTEEGTVCGDPLALWMGPRLKSQTTFLEQNESHQIAGIEVGFHGDKGINGARGTIAQYSRLGVRTVIGHSHSPGIKKGAYQTGTMTGRLEYQSGPGTHAQCHVLIYPNGKRQHIFVIKGHWRGE